MCNVYTLSHLILITLGMIPCNLCSISFSFLVGCTFVFVGYLWTVCWISTSKVNSFMLYDTQGEYFWTSICL